MNILFTCAGRRNYLINYFKEELIGVGNVLAADMDSTAPSLADADYAFEVNKVTHPDYINNLLTICRDYSVNAIISLNDIELPVLAKNKCHFERQGVPVIVSSKEVIDTCFDKFKTIEFANRLNIKTPPTYTTLQDVKSALNENQMNFPLVVKPRWGSGSIGLQFPENETELELAYQLIDHKIDRTIIANASKQDRDNAIVIQKKISNREFGLDIINDLDGNHRAVIVKEKLRMRSGETDKAKTVYNEELKEIGRKIGTELGHIGNLDCDIMEENGEYYLIEMNPRFGGGYPFSHNAGANVPKAILHWLRGEQAPDECFEVKNDLSFSKCDQLISLNDRTSKTEWVN